MIEEELFFNTWSSDLFFPLLEVEANTSDKMKIFYVILKIQIKAKYTCAKPKSRASQLFLLNVVTNRNNPTRDL